MDSIPEIPERRSAFGLASIQRRATPYMHKRSMSAVARAKVFRPFIVTASHDETVRIYDADTLERRFVVPVSYSLNRVAVLRDSATIAVGCDDGHTVIIDAETGTMQHLLAGHKGFVWGVAFSNDGKHLASSSYDNTICLWAAETWTLKQVLTGHTSEVRDVAFSPDSQLLASASDDHTIILWDIHTGAIYRVLRGHSKTVFSVDFAPCDTTLVSGSWDHTLGIWSSQSGQRLATLTGHTKNIYTVKYDADGKWIASGSEDKTVRIWNTDDYSCIRIIECKSPVWTVLFSPDTGTLLTGCKDGTVCMWNFQLGQCLHKLTSHYFHVHGLGFSESPMTHVDWKRFNSMPVPLALRLAEELVKEQVKQTEELEHRKQRDVAALTAERDAKIAELTQEYAAKIQTLSAKRDKERQRREQLLQEVREKYQELEIQMQAWDMRVQDLHAADFTSDDLLMLVTRCRLSVDPEVIKQKHTDGAQLLPLSPRELADRLQITSFGDALRLHKLMHANDILLASQELISPDPAVKHTALGWGATAVKKWLDDSGLSSLCEPFQINLIDGDILFELERPENVKAFIPAIDQTRLDTLTSKIGALRVEYEQTLTARRRLSSIDLDHRPEILVTAATE